MSENETETKVESTTEAASAPAAEQSTAKKSKKGIIAAILVVALIILGVLYALEKQGRSSTSIFAGFIEYQEANAIVATVNGDNIINAQLDTSINQFTQVAAAQGVDVTSPEIQADIRDQALDVLINTTLLKQAAAERGIDVTDEEVTERLDSITADLGGEEVLVTRMEELGIDAEQLHSDIRDEIVIQELLEVLFAEAAVDVMRKPDQQRAGQHLQRDAVDCHLRHAQPGNGQRKDTSPCVDPATAAVIDGLVDLDHEIGCLLVEFAIRAAATATFFLFVLVLRQIKGSFTDKFRLLNRVVQQAVSMMLGRVFQRYAACALIDNHIRDPLVGFQVCLDFCHRFRRAVFRPQLQPETTCCHTFDHAELLQIFLSLRHGSRVIHRPVTLR